MPDGAVNSSPLFPKAGSTASGAIRKSSSAPLLLLLLIAGLGAGGAVYWFKFRKQKPDTKGPDDLDDYDFGDDDEDDEEEYVIEDDQPEETDEV